MADAECLIVLRVLSSTHVLANRETERVVSVEKLKVLHRDVARLHRGAADQHLAVIAFEALETIYGWLRGTP